MSRRVVITGIGLVTSLGLNAQDTWRAMLAGKSGVSRIENFDVSHIPCKIASAIGNFEPESYISTRDIRKMDRFIQLGIVASEEAIHDSGWHPEDEIDKERTGVIVGSGIGGLLSIERTSVAFHNSEGRKKVSPYFIPASLINLLPGHISIRHGFSGPNTSVVTACSTGAHAIGDATRMIKYGDVDVMIAGGAEASITPTGMIGFAAAKALAVKFNDNPTEASRPWDVGHAGFVMGEGAGIVVLEEYDHAVKRGAKIYAEVAGYGLTGDAFHMTAPNGRGAFRAMQNALRDGNINPDQIDYINAHGTSTQIGDAVEVNQVRKLFGEAVKMSSTKSSIGHLLGAAGSTEIIFVVLAIRDQIAPATLNLHNPIKEAIGMDLLPLYAQDLKINYALSNSFGFGGTNASLVIRRV